MFVGRPSNVAVVPSPPQAESSDGSFEMRVTEALGEDESITDEDSAPEFSPTPLPDANVDAILARLPSIEEEEGDRADFALREKSQKAPKAGATELIPFPPSYSPEKPESASSAAVSAAAGALEVVRCSPVGDVPVAGTVSITFSQPMVELGTVDDVAAQHVPVKITPLPEGSFRWVGTQTLLFEPTYRMPMATHYSVEVGPCSSVLGNKLAKTEVFKLSTPPVTLGRHAVSTGPGERLVALSFDQRVDSQAVLAHLEVVHAEGKADFRLFTEGDRERFQKEHDDFLKKCYNGTSFPSVVSLIDKAEESTCVAVVVSALPADMNVTVRLKEGLPCLEGDRKTERAQEFKFDTHGTLRITDKTTNATSRQAISVSFSNTLDCEVLHPDEGDQPVLVRLEPSVEDMECYVSGSNNLCIRGETKGNTTYTVTVCTTVVDIYGQHLPKEESFTVTVMPLRPQLSAFRVGMYTLDPFAKPGEKNFSYNLMATNIKKIKFAVWQVDPQKDFPTSPYSMSSSRHVNRDYKSKTPSDYFKGGKLVREWEEDTGCETDVAKLISLDLQQFLQFPKEGYGQVVVFSTSADDAEGTMGANLAWIQVTQLAVSCSSLGDMFIYCNRLSDGSPVGSASIASCDTRKNVVFKGIGSTDASGCLTTSQAEQSRPTLIAKSGNDQVLFHSVAVQLPVKAQYWGHIVSDRGMYKPKETVRAKGWIRRAVAKGPFNSLELVEGLKGTYQARDSRGGEIAKGSVTLNKHGAFDLSFELPDTVNLGATYTQVTFKKNFSTVVTATLNAQVQEFRTPKFKASASLSSPTPKFTNGSFVCEVSASYFSGGALESSPAEWTVTAKKGTFTPPGHRGFTFSESQGPTRWFLPMRAPNVVVATGAVKGTTDGDGCHKIAVECSGQCERPSPVTVTADVRVVDEDQQSIGASCSTVVHPSSVYVGLKKEGVATVGGDLGALLLVSDVGGKVLPEQKVHVELLLVVHKRRGPQWVTDEVLLAETDVVTTDKNDGTKISGLSIDEGGTYKLRAFVVDNEGRKNQSCISVWCAGKPRPGRSAPPPSTPLQLIANKSSYAPGDEAEFTVVAPFFPCEGYYTVSAAGVVKRERFSVGPDGSATFSLLITDDFVPTIHVEAVVDGVRDDDGHPISSNLVARETLQISRASRELRVVVAPAKAVLQPGQKTSVRVTVLTPMGKPVKGAEVTVIIVDDAVLALDGYSLQSPLDAFYSRVYARPPSTSTSKNQVYVLKLADVTLQSEVPRLKVMKRSVKRGRGGGAGGGGAMFSAQAECAMMPMAMPMARDAMMCKSAAMDGAPPVLDDGPMIAERTNFDPLACFEPSLITNASGEGVVEVDLPDNLTSYRVWAIASHESDCFGFEEKSLTACLPVMVRPSLPRFLNFGDVASAPVMIQNQSSGAITVQIAARSSNLRVTGSRGFSVTLPKGKRTKVFFDLEADDQVGTGKVQIGAVTTDGFADSALVSFPIWTPATSEAFATYGELDNEGAIIQPVLPPSNVYKQFGGLSVTLSSTALQSLTDSFLYVYRYQFDCNEQLASRCMAILTLGDILHAFKVPKTPSKREMLDVISSSVVKLAQRQKADGSFGYWSKTDVWTSPYVSVHVGWMLAKLKEKKPAGWDVDVPRNMEPQLVNYLKGLAANVPSKYRHHSADLIAMSVFVLHSLGSKDDAMRLAKKLFGSKKLEEFSLEALGRLLVVFGSASESGKEILAFLKNRVTETAETANFVTSYRTGTAAEGAKFLLLASNQRTDGVVLEALLRTDKDNTLLPKVVKGLLAHRKKGRWGNTQENCQSLVALELYFRLFEGTAPDFTARMWIGEDFAGQASYKGYSTTSHKLLVPMADIMEATATGGGPSRELCIQKSGSAGRLYYRLGLNYAPKDPRTDSRDCGFFVERSYEAIDDEADVSKTPGGYRIRSGARVRVRLTMTNTSRRYHVALVDKMPAGFEAVNPALKTSEPLPAEEKQQEDSPGIFCGMRCGFSRSWFEHQNLRDERAEAFASLLWEGVHRYAYVARATCKGTFVTPPATAEEMYSPEVFGASPGLLVEIV